MQNNEINKTQKKAATATTKKKTKNRHPHTTTEMKTAIVCVGGKGKELWVYSHSSLK